MSDLKKSIEITDAKIKFVSLVDKAANKKAFLLTKQEADGSQGFQTNGRIIKVDGDSHYVTGVVYEPMVADAHDNFMTEAEIDFGCFHKNQMVTVLGDIIFGKMNRVFVFFLQFAQILFFEFIAMHTIGAYK